MRVIDYENLAFPIEARNFENSAVLLNFADEANVDVKFKVMETDERGKDIYSVMANGHKLGNIGKADREMRVFFCAVERKMLRSEKISSRLFRRSRGERSDKKERAEGKKAY